MESQIVTRIIHGKPINKPYLGHIISNTLNGLDADKLDYFTRDSQCTSFKIGCDWQRIIYESRVIQNEIWFPYKLVGDIWNLYQTRFRLYRDLYFHKTVRKVEELLLETMRIADEADVFHFRDCDGNYRNLAHSIDDVDSFLHTQDDILGQMERSGIPEVQENLKRIISRDFKDVNTRTCIAHYGMHKENPLNFVKFFNKLGEIVNITTEISTMCPSRFMTVIN